MRYTQIGIVVLALIAISGTASAQERADADVQDILADWKSKPKELAQQLIAKYGEPQEATANVLIWRNNGPWKRSVLINEEIPHDFPIPHTDMLEQVIDYGVPPEKFDELAEYDGSVIAERTRGEISARCDKEEANFLALNLANDIVTGKMSSSEAREFYAEAVIEKKHPEYMQGLVFEVPQSDTGDRDKPASGATPSR
ncbi:MAG: hypothetical protein H0W36_04690 [Gemmatimonadetes bacterium]|nr:hypothetical protein [Gemmatimonadota bacterium]